MLAHKENSQTALFARDSKAMTMKVGIHFGVCSNSGSESVFCEKKRLFSIISQKITNYSDCMP